MFYDVMFINGEVHCMSLPILIFDLSSVLIVTLTDVGHDTIQPAFPTPDVLRSLFASSGSFCRYFTGVDIDLEQQRGRLITSQELRTTFPDDDAAGASWVRTGQLKESLEEIKDAASNDNCMSKCIIGRCTVSL